MPSQWVPFSSCLHREAMNQFTMRSPASNEGPRLRWISPPAALPDHDQVNRDQTEPRARAGWARGLMAAAPFCELAKSPHDVGSQGRTTSPDRLLTRAALVTHVPPQPHPFGRGSVYTCSAHSGSSYTDIGWPPLVVTTGKLPRWAVATASPPEECLRRQRLPLPAAPARVFRKT